MSRGKEIAQGAHASLTAALSAQVTNKADLEKWHKEGQTKITLQVQTEDELIALQAQAEVNKLPVALIVDSGRTQFKGVHTITALAIGPADSEKIDKITKDLKLY